jgi:hypothetical protein
MSVLARFRPPRGGLALALAGAVPLAAFGASAAVANRGGPVAAAPPAASAPETSPHDCAGGEEDLVTVELAPASIAVGRGGDRMAVEIDVHHHFDAPAAVVGAAEVIDDRGRRVGKAGELGVRALPARSRTGYRIETPDRLADGYYRVQVSVLARAEQAGGADDFSTHQLYFHVDGGALTPITSNEWLTRSASGLAFSSP